MQVHKTVKFSGSLTNIRVRAVRVLVLSTLERLVRLFSRASKELLEIHSPISLAIDAKLALASWSNDGLPEPFSILVPKFRYWTA